MLNQPRNFRDSFSLNRGQNPDRVAAVAKMLRPLSALINVAAAVGLGGRLRRVNDANNLSYDIRLMGGFLLVIKCEKVSVDQK